MKNSTIYTFLFSVLYVNVNAQCAMCKAAAEANLKEGGTAGAGLNDGILYLMAMPYVAMLFFAIFYFLQKRNKKAT